MYWVVPSRPVSIRTFYTRTSEVEVANRQGFQIDLGVLLGPVGVSLGGREEATGGFFRVDSLSMPELRRTV